MSIAREYMESFLVLYENAKKQYTQLSLELRRNDLATQDLLHFIEFQNIDSVMGFPTLKKLKELRLERRLIKNEAELLQRLVDSIDYQKMQNLLGKIVAKEEDQKTRHYTPRVFVNGPEDLTDVSNL